ncbi:MAG: hypothetical protein MRERC_4c025 [Mycoplasmataceae bacterium RC_NB112A]|nr:MAG: hypothetical protein MRERC_4c025 [Mycoplasmataceae bacterium RC_NB112A]
MVEEEEKFTKKDRLHRKLRVHAWNFSPGRLKNVDWRQRENKRKKTTKVNKNKRKRGKLANNLTKWNNSKSEYQKVY